MKAQECTTCGGTGTVLDSGPSWCDEYGRIHEEPVLRPCDECTDEPQEEPEE